MDRGARVEILISNNPNAGALNIAKTHHIPTIVVREPHAKRDQKICEVLKQYNVTVVILAGWLKLITPTLLNAYPKRILNIHPGPLPRFGGAGMYGLAVHAAVLKAGLKETYPSVHIVNEAFDEGPVLDYGEKVPVLTDDTPETLQEREKQAEYQLYWRVIKKQFCK